VNRCLTTIGFLDSGCRGADSPVERGRGIAAANSQASAIRGDPAILFVIDHMTARFLYVADVAAKMRG